MWRRGTRLAKAHLPFPVAWIDLIKTLSLVGNCTSQTTIFMTKCPKLMQILELEVSLCFLTCWLGRLERKHKKMVIEVICRHLFKGLPVLHKKSYWRESCWEPGGVLSSFHLWYPRGKRRTSKNLSFLPAYVHKVFMVGLESVEICISNLRLCWPATAGEIGKNRRKHQVRNVLWFNIRGFGFCLSVFERIWSPLKWERPFFKMWNTVLSHQ